MLLFKLKTLTVFSVVTLTLFQGVIAGPKDNNQWYSFTPDAPTTFIFVHGIFSNSSDCWTSKSGAYWPEIVRKDPRLENPSIFLGGYYTDFTSGIYRVQNAADELLTYLRNKDTAGRPAPMESSQIIFIAHSTGGLVVRYLLERNFESFANKRVGLVLMASPSRGSGWANRLRWIHQSFGNKMANELQRDNDFVMDLDGRFFDLVTKRKNIVGIDIFENKFILPGFWFDTQQMVPASDSASYFGAYKVVPGSDHFSIVKPEGMTSNSHQFLVDFYVQTFKRVSAAVPIQPTISADLALKIRDTEHAITMAEDELKQITSRQDQNTQDLLQKQEIIVRLRQEQNKLGPIGPKNQAIVAKIDQQISQIQHAESGPYGSFRDKQNDWQRRALLEQQLANNRIFLISLRELRLGSGDLPSGSEASFKASDRDGTK